MRRPTDGPCCLKIVGARANNLKNVTADIPLVRSPASPASSGGGKSTLLIDTLYRAVASPLERCPRNARRP
ncbi:MAG: hypothetical protein R3D02_00385 [Hyphomicrobiales bacterium]